MVDQQIVIQNMPRDRVDETEVWTGHQFVVTSSRPIKAMLKVVKIDNLTLQNLPEGRELELNVIKLSFLAVKKRGTVFNNIELYLSSFW